MAMSNPPTPDELSPQLRQVLEAFIAGEPAPPDVVAALSEADRAEIAALTRTAQFTRLVLQSPLPSPETEAAALARAREAFAKRGFPIEGMEETEPAPPRPALLAWLERLRRKPQ